MKKICEIWESVTGEVIFKFTDYYPDDKAIEMMTQIEEACERFKKTRTEGIWLK